MSKIEQGWEIFKKVHVNPQSDAAAIEQLKFAFFTGTLQHHHMLNDASKLNDFQAIQAVNEVDREVEAFQAKYIQAGKARQEGIENQILTAKHSPTAIR